MTKVSVFYIKHKNFSRFSKEKLAEIFKTHKDIRVLVSSYGDYLRLHHDSGVYWQSGSLEHLTLSYNERHIGSYGADVPAYKGECHYMVMTSEYFPLNVTDKAVDALSARASRPKYHQIEYSGLHSYTLEEIRAINAQGVASKFAVEVDSVVVTHPVVTEDGVLTSEGLKSLGVKAL